MLARTMTMSGNPGKAGSSPRTLLVEIGTEELPPKALQSLSHAFAGSVVNVLQDAGMLKGKDPDWQAYATPRRLAVRVGNVLGHQPDWTESRRGPSLKAAFDAAGEPTPAALGFARSCGVPVGELETQKTDKGEWMVHTRTVRGESLDRVASDALAGAIRALPIPKRMRWGDCDHEFVRPVHWLLALHGETVLDFGIMGLKADRITQGHRFHAPGFLSIRSADDYAMELERQGFVIADRERRTRLIEERVARLAAQDGLEAVPNPELLDEVAGLTEWPIAMAGAFDERFLKLPKEVLVATMTSHQKYFCTEDAGGRIASRFVVIANLDSSDPERVRKGNERVLRARLADAEFFWNTDRKIRLEERVERLGTVIFHNRLGSVYDKTCRIGRLAALISDRTGMDVEATDVAARLCKTDLVTDMVGEFPALQGVIGRHYALDQGIDPEVADAIDAHYMPRFSGDRLPPGGIASSLALADRVDTLCGIFACGDVPSGERDPFSLRRASLGVLRILMENRIDLDLGELIDWGMDIYRDAELPGIDTGDTVRTSLFEFVLERSRGLLQGKGYSVDLWQAVKAVSPTRPLDFLDRIESVHRFVGENREAAESIIAMNKRISNILTDDSAGSGTDFDIGLAEHDCERELATILSQVEAAACEDMQNGHYVRGLETLARVHRHVDNFFDQVMVMAEDIAVRNNRTTLLGRIRSMFLEVADFSKIRLES